MSKVPTYSQRMLILSGLMALSAGCTVVGPDYQRPEIDVPSAYKEANHERRLHLFAGGKFTGMSN